MDQILEELRLNTEDLHELANQAVERARRKVDEARATRLRLERERTINAPKKS
jgi:vacuolar-type H+-ATPase subunit H